MDYSYIKIEIKNKICYLTINRPDNLNSLNIKLIDELSLALKKILILIINSLFNNYRIRR